MSEPRLLTAEQAAAYMSLPVSTFRKLGVGRVRFSAHVRYDRVAIDAWLDQQSGIIRQTASLLDDDSPDAALARFIAANPDLASDM